jgi:hypothetical protein
MVVSRKKKMYQKKANLIKNFRNVINDVRKTVQSMPAF